VKSKYCFLIALGSNMRHPALGNPASILVHAVAALEMADIDVFAHSGTISSKPIGPSQRKFANAAALLTTTLPPPALLVRLQQIEAHFGRRKRGRKWRERILDIDIILWSGGIWSNDNPPLQIPHSELEQRHFVLKPAAGIAPHWRDPISGLTMLQMLYRINRSKRVDPHGNQY
jgi:2-amino-4-hydroxy-6-hydroxymethyldihydropteridine diphosphokinase